jgi:uncharacterized membrane protein
MPVTHIIVIIFILITVAFFVWLEVHSRRNAKKNETITGTKESSARERRAETKI